MPEPLAIGAATIGFVTTIGTVRNAISQILKDYDTIKYHHESLIPTAIKLTSLRQEISLWQKEWQVYDGTRDQLLKAYWGPQEYLQILQLLRHLCTESARLQRKFEQSYGPLIRNETEGQRISIESEGVNTDRREARILSELYRKLKELPKRLKEAGRATLIQPLYLSHLDELQSSVELLDKYSRKLFIKYAADGQESKWEFQRSSVQVQSHLTYLATKHWRASDTLHQFLTRENGLSFDLHLSPAVEVSERIEHLAKGVLDDSLEFRFSMRDLANEHSSGNEILCRLPSGLDDATLLDLLDKHFRRITNTTPHGEDTTGRPAPYSPKQMHRLPNPWELRLNEIVHEGEVEEVNLRTLLNRHKEDHEEFLHGLFTCKERHRLAYELAEWALVFLKTECFAELCSCRIFRVEDDSLKTSFRTRIGRVEHIDTTLDRLQNERQWCEVELRRMHICRLANGNSHRNCCTRRLHA